MMTTTPIWVYDDSPIADPMGYGERAVKFLRALRHPKNPAPGNPFQLDRWQERIIRRIYGPRHPDGTRIVKTVVLLLPRGNRKTALSAALALLHTVGPERVPGGEVLSAASDRKQARLGFTEAVGLVRAHPKINAVTSIQDYKNRLVSTKYGSFYEAMSCDAGTQHGRTPCFALADELHAWKKRDLWDVVKSGLVKVPGSLLVVATTAGRGQDNLAHDIIADARRVARGDIVDESFLPILFETSPDANWRDENVWRLANPGLSCNPAYPDLEGLRQLAREAERRPNDREAFRQLNLNTWLDSAENPFVSMEAYDQGAHPIDLDKLEADQTPCWLGVDLSSSVDLSVIVAAWPDGNNGFLVHPWFFIPKANVLERQDISGAPYLRWVEEKLVTATEGNTIDTRTVEAVIREICATFNVQQIAFDPALARPTMSNLVEDGLPAIEMPQRALFMMPALAELERAVIAGRLIHGGHPVLRWTFANAEAQTNSHGHIVRLLKSKRWLSIDGAVACAMAVQCAAAGDTGQSIYDSLGDDFENWAMA
ncbi:terminase TerL endonuclease subunit [Pararhizobium sp. YC-54]|uniref:terminase large subunit n=1 Tax=Pararhizobium sp. YC-54 TaxID=2986920 RepID=UPI00299D5355|nr:terminase TerL endonuclease subunit [Pararhizobium sp. YC-54]